MALSTETRVGVFVIIGLALLLVGTLIVEDVNPFGKGYMLRAYFSSVEGLTVGNVVTMAGVECGKVKEMRLLPTGVEVFLDIREGTIVREDSKATIAIQTVLGGKKVAMTMGSPDKPRLTAGDEIETEPIHGLTDIAVGLGGDLEALVAAIDHNQAEISRRLVHFLDENSGKVSNTLSNIEEITGNLRSGKGTVGKILSDESFYDEMVETVASIRRTSARAEEIMGKNEAKLSQVVSNVADITEQIQTGKGTLGALIYDEELYRNIASASDDLGGLAESAKKIFSESSEQLQAFAEAGPEFLEAAKHLRSLTQKMAEGEGTLGLLASDDSLYDEAKKMLAEIRGAVADMREQIPAASFMTFALRAAQ